MLERETDRDREKRCLSTKYPAMLNILNRRPLCNLAIYQNRPYYARVNGCFLVRSVIRSVDKQYLVILCGGLDEEADGEPKRGHSRKMEGKLREVYNIPKKIF